MACRELSTGLPDAAMEPEKYAKCASRRDRVLALIILLVELSLLYLVGDPEEPIGVWKKFSDTFQKRLGQTSSNFDGNCTC